MAEVGSAFISIVPSMRNFGRDVTRQANSELDPASRKIGSGFGSKLGLAMKSGLAVGGVALAAFGKASLDAASDAQQSLGATETVFGKFAGSVIKSSNDAAQAYGLSANEYRENANVLGALFKNQGVQLRDLGGATDGMIGKAADLAATFGGTTSDAVGALSAAFKGEFDSLEKYGVSLKASTIQAELAARGQDKLTGAALAAATQQATTDLIFRQSKDSLGAFGRESDTLAGQQQRLGAQFENFKATIGTALLPVVTQFFGYLNTTALPALTSLGSYLSTNFGPAFERVRTVVSGFLGGSSGDVGGWAANIKSIFTDVVTIATRLWDTFGADIVRYATNFLKNTQQIIGGGLNVIAGIFKTISAVMRGDWGKAWEGIKQIASGAKDVLAGLMKALFNLLQTAVSVGWKVIKGLFSAAWDGLKTVVSNGVDKVVDFVKALPGRISSVAEGAFDSIKNAFTGAINFIIDAWNGLSFTLPKVTLPEALGGGSVGGQSFGTPNIPRLARGTDRFGGGVALVGEKGPELVTMPRGVQVVPNNVAFGRSGPMEVTLSSATIREMYRLAQAQGQITGKVINGAAAAGQRRRAG